MRLNRYSHPNELPTELLCAIFRFLDEDSLRNTPSRVCSRWRTVALGDALLWTRLNVSTRVQSEKAVPEVVRRARGLGLRVRFFVPHPIRGGVLITRTGEDERVVPGPSYAQCGTTLAGHVRELVIGGRVTAPGSSITSFVSRLLEFQGTVQLVGLRIEHDYGLSATSSAKFRGQPSLRRLSSTLRFAPGSWMKGLTHLDLVEDIRPARLLKILSCTPNLRSLQLLNDLKPGSAFVSPPQPPAVTSLEQIVCKCETDEELGCWMNLLEHIVPPGRSISRIAVPGPAPGIDVARYLLRDIGSIRALHVTAMSDLPGLIRAKSSLGRATRYTLADDRDRRRQFSLLSVPVQDSSDVLRGLFGADNLLRGLTHLTVPPVYWDTLNELLCGDMDLKCLRTINFCLHPVWKLRDRSSAAEAKFSTDVTLRAPSLQEIALVLAAGSDSQTNQIAPEIAACYIIQLDYDTQNPPILRLVNICLDQEGGPVGEAVLLGMVSRIEQSSWDYTDPQLEWVGVPEYAFGWEN